MKKGLNLNVFKFVLPVYLLVDLWKYSKNKTIWSNYTFLNVRFIPSERAKNKNNREGIYLYFAKSVGKKDVSLKERCAFWERLVWKR